MFERFYFRIAGVAKVATTASGFITFRLICYRKNTDAPIVYNAASIECTWSDLITKGRQGNRKFTYPTFGLRGMTSIAAVHWTLVLLFEWLPSALCDTILGLVGAKKRYNELAISNISDVDPSNGT